MGKENIMTGKSDPVGGLASSNNKTSFVNSPFQKIKPSKFKQTWFLLPNQFRNYNLFLGRISWRWKKKL